MEKSTNIDVAILMDDLNDTKEISDVFRKIGIIPYFYEDLKTFWGEILDKTPTLCVVDVKKMSDGNLLLKNHPHIKAGTFPLVFFYSSETRPLLMSTFDIFHLGLIRKTISYQGQIKSILRRLNLIIDLQVENGELLAQNDKLDSKVAGMIGEVGVYREKNYYNEVLTSICQDFEKSKSCEDFFAATSNVISSRSEFLEFAYLELGADEKKLVSPKSADSKFREIPSLWIGKSCCNGIEPFAQNMASQVCIDLIEGDLISLMVRGRNPYPDVMMFIKTESEELLNMFNWEEFENYLSGIYLYFQVKNSGKIKNSKNYLGPWEFLTQLDRYFFNETPSGLPSRQIKDDEYLIDVNFSKLLESVRSMATSQIHWKNFFSDFIGRFEAQQKNSFRLTCMGVAHMGFLVDERIGNEFFRDLKSYVARFGYWRYFEGLKGVIAPEIRPTLRMVPLSSEAYLKHIEGDSISAGPFSIRPGTDLDINGQQLEISRETLGEL